jgi:hypothetical protein
MILIQKCLTIIFFVAFFSAISVCIAEETLDYPIYLQGGKGILSDGENGTMVLKISEIVPYYQIRVLDRSYLMPIQDISGFALPLNAALVISNNDGEIVSLVKISNWSTDKDNAEINLVIKPLEFYEGTVLDIFNTEKQEISPEIIKNSMMVSIYGEIQEQIPENEIPMCPSFPRPMNSNEYNNMNIYCQKICGESCPSCQSECQKKCSCWPAFGNSYEQFKKTLPPCCKT